MNLVEQGESFDFTLDIDDEDATCTLNVVQFPGEVPDISRVIAKVGGEWPVTITRTESAALAVGQWFAHATMDSGVEGTRQPVKFYISKSWT